ncbi:MAG: zinc ribbon domain-containing protein [Clostridia bacterium]|nr:zinc ribbon domain-containing protein [Clostridia bacterium]
MLKCNKCGGACADDALYCTECGNRLSTDACRKCGDYLPKEVKFCAHCGYPTKGTVCNRCGKTNPDEANFCLSCGSKLGGAIATETKLAPTTSDAAVREVKKTTVNAGGGTGKAAFAHNVVRAFVLPLLLMVLFISSFFGMFKTIEFETYLKVPVTGFDAVRGIFLLMNPPTEEEVEIEYADFYKSGEYKSEGKAIRDFGYLRKYICEENIDIVLILQTLLWGLISLSLMVITLTFFILSLYHAIQVARKKATGFFRYETLPLSLVFALTFAFIIAGGPLAGAAISMLFVAAAGLSAITTLKYTVEKQPRPGIIANVRRGVCAALVVFVACFASSGLVTVRYMDSDIKTTSPADELYDGMYNYIDDIEEMVGEIIGEEAELSAKALDETVGLIIESNRVTLAAKRLFLRMFLSPVTLCFTAEAVESFETPAIVVSWLMFFSNLFFGAMCVMLLLRMLQEEANPQKQYSNKTSILWNVLFVVGSALILGFTIPYIVMGNSISKSLELHSSYGMSGLIIAAVALGVVLIVTEIVMRSVDKNGKKNKNDISQYI